MASMSEFFNTLNGADEIKKDVVDHLVAQGLDDPGDLGFLANAAGGVNEGIVRRGCPSTWGTEHFRVLRSAIMC